MMMIELQLRKVRARSIAHPSAIFREMIFLCCYFGFRFRLDDGLPQTKTTARN